MRPNKKGRTLSLFSVKYAVWMLPFIIFSNV